MLHLTAGAALLLRPEPLPFVRVVEAASEKVRVKVVVPELLIGDKSGPAKLTVGAVFFTVAVELAAESEFIVPAPLFNVLASSLIATVPSPRQPVTDTEAPALDGLETVATQATTEPVVTSVIPEPLAFVKVVEAAPVKVRV